MIFVLLQILFLLVQIGCVVATRGKYPAPWIGVGISILCLVDAVRIAAR